MRRTMLLLLLIAASCRPRVTTPPLTVSDPTSVPPPARTAEALPSTVVPNPQDEFGTGTPDAPIVATDIAEAQRTARERGEILDAFFLFDAATLDADARGALDRTAAWLRAHPETSISIEGHCDERGTEQYNLALGDRRGAAAADYLATLGVARDRISTVSYGEERPFARGGTEEAWKQNRRAHIVLTGRP